MNASGETPMGIRWTIGDVSPRGFETLHYSVWGAWRLFGREARYTICVNTVSLGDARDLTGDLPPDVEWRPVTVADFPAFLMTWLDAGLAEGVAWKLAPVRLWPDRYELAFDNDCVLWELPDALARWLDGAHAGHGVVAEDVARCFGQFDARCGPHPCNSGIRGLPPGFDFEAALRAELAEQPVKLHSSLDAQGLECSTLQRTLPLLTISTADVSLCSPFPPHQPQVGRCGAHFAGQNARWLPWSLFGKPAVTHLIEHWNYFRLPLRRRVHPVTRTSGAAAELFRPE